MPRHKGEHLSLHIAGMLLAELAEKIPAIDDQTITEYGEGYRAAIVDVIESFGAQRKYQIARGKPLFKRAGNLREIQPEFQAKIQPAAVIDAARSLKDYADKQPSHEQGYLLLGGSFILDEILPSDMPNPL